MAKLSTLTRKKLPASTFGLPKQRAYPMPDASHARLAKSGASRALNVGNITPAQKSTIDRKANQKLAGKSFHATAVSKMIGKKGY